jgi:FMN-dependent NADH-azoreductase
MKLLHIDSSILGDNAASRPIMAAVAERLHKEHPHLETRYRDLAADPLPHLTLARLPGAQPPAASDHGADATLREQAESQKALDEFLAADIVVIGAPMYNFTIPTQLKAWIDRILVAGKTFRYTDKGAQGLAGGKRVIAVVSRGGVYGADTPAAAAEHVESYLRAVFGFIGVTDVEFIIAEGLQMGPEASQAALAQAMQTATALKAA